MKIIEQELFSKVAKNYAKAFLRKEAKRQRCKGFHLNKELCKGFFTQRSKKAKMQRLLINTVLWSFLPLSCNTYISLIINCPLK